MSFWGGIAISLRPKESKEKEKKTTRKKKKDQSSNESKILSFQYNLEKELSNPPGKW